MTGVVVRFSSAGETELRGDLVRVGCEGVDTDIGGIMFVVFVEIGLVCVTGEAEELADGAWLME